MDKNRKELTRKYNIDNNKEIIIIFEKDKQDYFTLYVIKEEMEKVKNLIKIIIVIFLLYLINIVYHYFYCY